MVGVRLPLVGERWRFCVGDSDGTEYWITFVNDHYIHLTDISSGSEESPYPIEVWRTAYYNDSWQYIERDTSWLCGKCEVNPRMENDYLCEECR